MELKFGLDYLRLATTLLQRMGLARVGFTPLDASMATIYTRKGTGHGSCG